MGPYSPRLRGNQGLSPRMRGNRWPSNTGLPYAGSIHAHAGDPWCPVRLARRLGSIPAHAGEPPGRTRQRVWSGVYPRACGGTDIRKTVREKGLGLSPRMRGNPGSVEAVYEDLGSIPAHAGEPWMPSRALTRAGVYPRACGGTSSSAHSQVPAAGLSPRMRGNQQRRLTSPIR